MKKISRRAFTCEALAAVAVASVTPATMAQTPPAVPAEPQPPADSLNAAGRAEAEARVQAILARHGSRLSDEQKRDVKRLVVGAQSSLEALRAYPLPNSAEPATVFRVRRNPGRPGAVESHERKVKS